MADEKKKREKNKQLIEKFLDNMLKGDIINRIVWVARAVPLADLRDVAIGFIIGTVIGRLEKIGLISEIINGSKLDQKDYENLGRALAERLPRIIEKVEREFCE